MHIEDILAKDIDRPLDGVVKASDGAQLGLEVREYVITAEVAGHLLTMLDAYTHPGKPESNGVWIAGFFGSGKSHLLKMLAHLLGDVDGAGLQRADVVSAFLEKVIAGDELLTAALNRSALIPARSLLFNIDEKVDKNEKDQPDALLKVFVQVFYEMAGYFGKSPYIARFERDLAAQGVFERFKDAFARHYGQPWEKGRELAVFAEPAVEKAYAEVTSIALERPLTAYRENYTVSIESFADEVAAWLGEQNPGMRLGFYVDEIGQFIGQDTKLMLSLQTIVETLFTRCRGQAWVVVTSQEIMDSIIGDRTAQQELDFSKIQARFAVQLKLDSKNVQEVVSKRLLEKTEEGAATLRAVYQVNEDRFRSLFAFQNQRTYRNYATTNEFIGTYPFVDYQFELFHKAMKGLSDFNAFTGRHASVGERSLLGVTREIGSAIKGSDVGVLATFDMFYDGIEKSVLSDVKHNITVAFQNLTGPDKDLAVRVLKALLMTKYVDEFEATAQSIAVLMTPQIDANIAALREQVERALQLLVSGTYVQRTGSTYAYLTNEEQDVEKAIKALERSDTAIKKLLNEEVVQASGIAAKVRHDATGVDLGLERLLDGERQGRSEPLSVYFMTPLSQLSLEDVKFRSVGQAGALFVVLDLDRRALEDVDLYVRTNAYVQLQMKSTLPESRRRILESQQRSNVERQREVLAVVRDAVSRASLVHNGSALSTAGATAKERVHNALQGVIEARYTRINEARAVSAFKDTDIARVLRKDETLDLEVKSSLGALTDAVIAQLRKAKVKQVTSSVGSLVEDLFATPFGWSMTAVLLAIAHGVNGDRVRLKLDSRALVRTEIPAELRSTVKHRQIVVEEVREQDPVKVRQLQDFLNQYRDVSDAPSNAEELVHRVRVALADDLTQLRGWLVLPYPFRSQVERAVAAIEPLATGHADEWYLGAFFSHTAELLTVKEDVLDPVRAFLNSPQRGIVDDARAFVQLRAAELDVADTADAAALRRALDDPDFLQGSGVPQIKQLHLRLQDHLDHAVAADRSALRNAIEVQFESLQHEPAYRDGTPAAQEATRSVIERVVGEVDDTTSLGQVALARSNFAETYKALVTTLINSPRQGPAGSGSEPVPVVSTISLNSVVVQGIPAVLRTPEQVEEYVKGLRTSLLAVIAEGKAVVR
jgi:hypothetical protein